MRVGFSTSVIQRGKTGIAQYIFSLLRAFQAGDFDCQFSIFALKEDRHFFEDLDERFDLVMVDEKFRPALKNILWHHAELPRLAGRLKLDVMHVPSYRRLLWNSLCPRVGTIHDLAPFHVTGKYDLARMIYGRVVVKRLARRQTEIIAVSENTARDIEHFFGIPRGRLNIIHNGVNHDRFYPRETSRIAAHKYRLVKPFFLYVARLEHPGKNHVRLIEAFERFKQRTRSDWILAFGGSDWHGAESIHQRIAASPNRDDILALGFVDEEDLPELYSSAAGFVYPSLFEGFGLPPIEAMACGCPVVCSSRGSLGEVVGDAAAIVDPEDVASISAALVHLAEDESWRETLKRKGAERARQFSWTRAAQETFRVYLRACGGAGQNEASGPAGVTARGSRDGGKRERSPRLPLPGMQQSSSKPQSVGCTPSKLS